MNDVDITIGHLSSCPVCVELDTLEDATEALGGGEVAAKLGYSEITLGGVVRVAAYVTSCPPAFLASLF